MKAEGKVRGAGGTAREPSERWGCDRHTLLDPWPGAVLVGVASGSETGWDSGNDRVSRLALTAMTTTLGRQRQPSMDALPRALDSTARALAAHDPPDADELVSASVTLLVGCVTPSWAELAWVGGERALLVRDGQVVEATRPQTLAEAYREQLGAIPAETDPTLLRLPTRTLSGQGIHGGEEGRARWALRHGDRLLLLSECGALIDAAELGRLASQGRVEQALGRVLDAIGAEHPLAAAVVLEIGPA